MNLKSSFSLLASVLMGLVFARPCAAGVKQVRLEILDPFPDGWFLAEPMNLFARVVNTGDEPIKVGQDLVFEVEGLFETRRGLPNARASTSYDSRYVDPFEQVPAHKPEHGVTVLPGYAYAVSETDLEIGITTSFPQMPVRFHYRIEDGKWVSSPWVQPKRLRDFPKFEGLPLFQYNTAAKRPPDRSVSIAEQGGERWLFGHVPGKTHYLTRLCRIPPGVSPVSFHHDIEASRLVIRFDSGEPDVVWDSRNGVPLAGSERTVPHLHLWKKFSGRPFTRPSAGMEPEPEVIVPITFKVPAEELVDTSTPFSQTSPRVPPAGENVSLVGARGEERPRWPWLLGGSLLMVALAVAWLLSQRRKA